jgi:hypothetical protein
MATEGVDRDGNVADMSAPSEVESPSIAAAVEAVAPGPESSKGESAARPLELGNDDVQAGSLIDHTGKANCARNQPRKPRDSSKYLFQKKHTHIHEHREETKNPTTTRK